MAVAIAIALVERGGLWLIDRRRTADEFDGLWEFPGGKIQPGESPAEAAVRECAEEVGLQVVPRCELRIVHHEYPTVQVTLHPVVCRYSAGEAQPRVSAIGQVRWVSMADLRLLGMPAANEAVIAALEQWAAGLG